MSSDARRRNQPEAHQREMRIAESPPRSWDGRVCITVGTATVDVRGTWQLQMPHEGRSMRPAGRAALPLPAAGDVEAWRGHLQRLVMLQVPGTQLRVRTADSAGWRTLEFAAPTAPTSVVHLDREAFGALLGNEATLRLMVVGAG